VDLPTHPYWVILVNLWSSLNGCLLRLTMTEPDVVEGAFVNLPGAFMPLRAPAPRPRRGATRPVAQGGPQRLGTPSSQLLHLAVHLELFPKELPVTWRAQRPAKP
jgi:hypothetical protein